MNVTNAMLLTAVIVTVGYLASGDAGQLKDPKYIVGAAAAALFLAVLDQYPGTSKIAEGFALLMVIAATLGYGPKILGRFMGHGNVATGAAGGAMVNQTQKAVQ